MDYMHKNKLFGASKLVETTAVNSDEEGDLICDAPEVITVTNA